MPKIPPQYRLPLGISIVFHLILLIVLVVELPKTALYRAKMAASTVKVVHAVAVNQQAVSQQIAQVKRQQHEKQAAELARINQLKQQVLAAKRRRIAEQARQQKLKADRLRLKKERIARAKALVLKKQREQRLQKKALEKALALKRLKEKQLEQTRALDAKQQQLQQKMLQQQMQQDQKQIEKMRAVQMQGVLDQYKGQIIQAIQNQWIVPDSANRTLSCVLLINLAPGGVVLNVKTLTSSGDPVLDRSARVAVFKASPLPVPKDPAVFEKFRALRLTVRPERVNSIE